ncbi:GTP cyclohydrolase 1 type 2 [Bacteroidota bacterium]|nr:GTP cyclohydrolase 1 type 2 [Bacteroidota bacterium]
MKLNEIIKVLEQFAPLQLQESYDNAGLITGNPEMEIKAALLTLDSTEEVIDEAIANNCNLIIAHHPIVFSGLKKINGKNYVERVIIKAIKNDIAIYAAHTNFDNVRAGVNKIIADKLGLINTKILSPKKNLLKKLFTFVPGEHAEAVRNALFSAGAGHIGNYSECSFNAEGFGTFNAGEGTNPFVGNHGIRHREEEIKVEVILPLWKEKQVVKALFDSHPYEEVAYDIVPLDNIYQDVGAGLIGELAVAMDEINFLKHIQKTMQTTMIRHTNFLNKKITRVAVCGGAGSFLLNDAINSGAQAFITADYKYHQFFDADGKVLICDIGHYESEQFTPLIFAQLLNEYLPTFATLFSKTNSNPIKYFH